MYLEVELYENEKVIQMITIGYSIKKKEHIGNKLKYQSFFKRMKYQTCVILKLVNS
jgi:TRAP-type mannitol/chloroaromatic compound transport system permease small subunit